MRAPGHGPASVGGLSILPRIVRGQSDSSKSEGSDSSYGTYRRERFTCLRRFKKLITVPSESIIVPMKEKETTGRGR